MDKHVILDELFRRKFLGFDEERQRVREMRTDKLLDELERIERQEKKENT